MRDFPLRLQFSSGEIMSLERDRVLVGFANPAAAAEADRVLSDLGLMVEEEVLLDGARRGWVEPYRPDADRGIGPMNPLNHTATRVWARTVDGTAFRAGIKPPEQIIEWVAPVYRLEAQEHLEPFALLPHVLLINFDSRQEEDRYFGLLDRYGLHKDTEHSEYLGEYGYFRILRPLEESSIELRSRLLAQGHEMVRDVQFEIMPMFVPLAYVPNDPDFVNQWNMRQISAGGTGQTAWNISRGDPSVVIAVCDSGCDLGHPDLDFVSNGINVGTPGANGSPIAHPTTPIGHGTACAGIAAATIQNATGVAGVAGECQILPVAFTNWTNCELACAIRYAAQNGARVISMSFVLKRELLPWRSIVEPAIQYAFDRNVVMCAATGNDNSSVGWPATHPLVMACGASGPDDNRISPTSPQNWLPYGKSGSNFGPEISVVAPGINIPTTDMRVGGFNPAASPSGDFIPDFWGTSAATPHVAGLAALLISVNKSLSNVSVQAIIESTADKARGDFRLLVLPNGDIEISPPTYSYDLVPGHPNGTWNQEMGYGRINARRAVIRAAILTTPFPDKSEVFDSKPEAADQVPSPRPGPQRPPFNIGIFEHILERLERLERHTGVGQPFITRSERPNVGGNITRRASEKK